MTYELAIIGAGPAGSAAAVYAARKQLNTVLIAEEFGGQSVVSTDIQNWIGTPSIAGDKLAKSFEEHVKAYAANYVTLHIGHRVDTITKNGNIFSITVGSDTISTKAILITTGSTRRKLEVPGADTFEHKGLTYCASCDGPLFANQDVVVIGGGNAAFESAAQLLAYAKSVTLLNRSDKFRADEITVEKVLEHPNMRAIRNAVPKEVYGDVFVKGIKYTDTTTNTEIDLPVSGIFIEIGLIPSTSFAKDVITLNERGQVVVDPKNQQTSTPMIWAAGDCTDGLYHQNNIAAGDGVKALEDIYVHLRAK